MSNSNSSSWTTNRFVLIGGGILVAAFLVGLAVSLSGNSNPSTTTTTTTVPVTSFRGQVVTTQQQTQAVATTFLSAVRACTSWTCMDNAAATALNAEGIISQKFNPVNFPTNASAAATNYSNLLVTLQRTYLSIGSLTNTHSITALLPQFEKSMRSLAQNAKGVEALL